MRADLFRASALGLLVLLAQGASGQALYSVTYSVAEISARKMVHIGTVTSEPADATRESAVAAHTAKFRQANPERAKLFTELQAKLFSSQPDAVQFRANLIENSKAAGMDTELFEVQVAASAAPVSAAVAKLADAAWPFSAGDAKGRQLQAAQAAGVKVEISAAGMDFVFIPAGEFVMGSPADEEGRNADELQHRVRISKPFYIAREERSLEDPSFALLQKRINALQSQAPAGWAFRLPTEAEWEWAARAGRSSAFYTGSELYGANFADREFKGVARYVNCEGEAAAVDLKIGEGLPPRLRQWTDGKFYPHTGIFSDRGQCDKTRATVYQLKIENYSGPAKARQFQPNAWGLFDVAGRLSELVSDRYAPYAAGPSMQVDPLQKAGTGRVVRGGNQTSALADVRLARRNKVEDNDLDADPMFVTMAVRLVLLKLED